MIQNKYYSQSAPKILELGDRVRIGKQLAGIIKQILPRSATKTCLDVGCSSGVVTKYLSDLFKKTIGIDADKLAIAGAKKTYKIPNLHFFIMDAQNMSFPDASFDVVILNQVYEFVDEPKLLIQEVERVLKPGGMCVVGARNKWTLIEGQTGLPLIHFLPQQWVKKIAIFFGSDYYPPTYLNIFDLQKLFSKFEIINITEHVLYDPKLYHFLSLVKYQKVINIIPKWLFTQILPFVPNFILICKKKS